MKLNVQRRLTADILRCPKKRIRFDPERLEEIKEAITKADLRSLINDRAIYAIKKRGISQSRTRKKKEQKRKGRQKGAGSRKGKRTARLSRKREWINRVRSQKKLIKKLREQKKIDSSVYQSLYMKIKGGFFRSRRHIKLYMEEQGIIKND